jgi:multiple antibiotic resistance protein
MVEIDFILIVQIFILLNPLSSFPFLMAAYRQKLNVKKIALLSVITAFAVALIIALTGPSLFGIFGISLDAFRIAGGVVLFLLGLDMIRPKEEEIEKVGSIDGLISIIATPMLTGPATISFITIKSYEIGQFDLVSNLVAAFVLVGVVFMMFSFMISKINHTVINITSRVLGLFLTAVSIEMIAQGINAFLVR